MEFLGTFGPLPGLVNRSTPERRAPQCLPVVSVVRSRYVNSHDRRGDCIAGEYVVDGDHGRKAGVGGRVMTARIASSNRRQLWPPAYLPVTGSSRRIDNLGVRYYQGSELRVVDDDMPVEVIADSPPTEIPRAPWFRRRGTLVGISVALVAAIAALVFTNVRADQKTVDASLAQSVPGLTIQQYIKDNGITSTSVRLGDPGAPKIVIALPAGWSDLGPDTPEWAYGAVQADTAPNPDDPPTITVLLSKLTGNVDPAKVLEYAPNELQRLPEYVSMAAPNSSPLNGFDAVQLAGRYVRDGTQRTIAQKTVAIPANGAVYVLQMNADALDSDAIALIQATDVIDKQTTITP